MILTGLNEQGLHAGGTPKLNVGVEPVPDHASAAGLEAVVLQHELGETHIQQSTKRLR